ncbi:hypothetical protein GCM10009838_02620 [Catenulispora subtropica]|uniref:Uncharacterized protein n=1 Tax=Catenulispora subtropica TaxID=450798 RepID=A0ABN2QEV1_9ACTN
MFISIRNAASCCQPWAEMLVPRAARTGRGPLVAVIAGPLSFIRTIDRMISFIQTESEPHK